MIADGTYMIPRKGEKAIQLPNATCVVVGNKHPQEVYPKMWPYIEARFYTHCVDEVPEIPVQLPPILRVPALVSDERSDERDHVN